MLPMVAATSAHAQMRALLPTQVAPAARTANFSVSDQSWTNDPALLAGGMITTEGTAANSFLGVGLVKMRGRKRSGADMRPGANTEVQTRNPAVTFVLKF